MTNFEAVKSNFWLFNAIFSKTQWKPFSWCVCVCGGGGGGWGSTMFGPDIKSHVYHSTKSEHCLSFKLLILTVNEKC